MFCKKVVLRNFAKFTGNHLYQGFFFNKVAGKTIFSFSKCSEKMVFPKKSHWNMIFLVLSGKMIFLFPENIILFFRRKMKDDQKKYGNMIFSSNVLKRWSFQKILHWILYGKMILFLPENMISFHWTKNERWSFSRNTWKCDFFCIYVQMLQIWYYPSAKKIQRRSSHEKIHLKVIDILDWHSRKNSNDSLYFYGDLHRRFYISLSSEKKQKQKNKTKKTQETWLLQFIWLEVFYNEESSILCTIQPQGTVFRRMLEGATKSYFTHYSCVVMVFFNTALCRSPFSTVSSSSSFCTFFESRH